MVILLDYSFGSSPSLLQKYRTFIYGTIIVACGLEKIALHGWRPLVYFRGGGGVGGGGGGQ